MLATSAVDQTLQGVFRTIIPEAALIAAACVLFVMSTRNAGRAAAGALALIGLGLAWYLWDLIQPPTGLIDTVAPVRYDGLGEFARVVALCTGVLLVFQTWFEPDDRRACDYQACLLCVIAGFSLACAANDLIFLFLAFELISIPTYVLLYLGRGGDRVGQEAAMKYFFLSVLSSAMLLFGFSYLYGATGTTNIAAIRAILPVAAAGDSANLALVAIVMIVAGIGFRITAFPFHFYAPDVYQGGPIGVVSMLAFVPKVAGFAALLRLFGAFSGADHALARQYMMLLWILAAATMTAGNVLALLQRDFRRMLAYSSVAHTGYMLIGLALLPAAMRLTAQGEAESIVNGADAVLFYLVAYGAMTLGVFAVLGYLNRPERTFTSIDDFGGLHETNPGAALVLTIFLFSLIGLPLTAGFAGKFMLFFGALSDSAKSPMGHLFQVLAIIGAVNAAIAAFYYLRVVGAIYLRGSFQPAVPFVASPVLFVIGVCAVLTVVLGIFPTALLNAARDAFAN